MNQIVTRGIVLRRIDYQEADRILTVLTPDQGKMSVIAKGARRAKSKLAGGIELFSISDITYIKGKKDIGTLTSSRLREHFGHITSDLDRTMLGYEMLKRVDKLLESDAEEDFFTVLAYGLRALNDAQLLTTVAELWFNLQLMQMTGHAPDFQRDVSDQPLQETKTYNFDYDLMRFAPHSSGAYGVQHIKLLRFAAGQDSPQKLSKLTLKKSIADTCCSLVKGMAEHNLHM